MNEHKRIVESNDKSNNESNDDDDDTDRAEWKIQLSMQNSCISTKNLEETCTIYSKSEPVEIIMGNHREDVIDKRFNTLLQRFQHAPETSNDKGREFIPESLELLNYQFQEIDIRRAESYIMSPNGIVN